MEKGGERFYLFKVGWNYTNRYGFSPCCEFFSSLGSWQELFYNEYRFAQLIFSIPLGIREGVPVGAADPPF